jgi:hypothetical protein
MIWLRSGGWPVEFVSGRPVLNFLRWLFQASVVASIRNAPRWYRCGRGLRRQGEGGYMNAERLAEGTFGTVERGAK